MRQTIDLLRAKYRVLVNYGRSDEGGWKRVSVFLLLGLSFALGTYFGIEWFLSKVVEIEPIGVVMVRRLLGLVLLFVFTILAFSNLIAAFSTLYLAEDLPTVMVGPVGHYSLYAARFIENSMTSAWMVLSFSLPFFIAMGQVMHAQPGYYAALVAVLISLAVIPTSFAVLVALLLGNLFSARRTRQVLVFLATAIFVALFVLFRNLEPERFLNPSERAPMLEVLQTLQGSDPGWLPSTWALDALWPRLAGIEGGRTHPVVLLMSFSAAGFFVVGWCFRRFHFPAFSRAQEGLDTRELIDGSRHAGKGRSLDELVAEREKKGGRHGLGRAVVSKDVRVFVRDTAQWTQMLLILALIIIYVVNFKYIRTVGDSGIITRTGLHFVNLALSGFVAVAVCVRFAFPSVSLEGRAFWMVLRSPNRVRDFLRSKWISTAVPLVILINVLVLLTNVWLDSGLLLSLTAALTVTPMAIGVAGLALGLGASYPRFKIDNAAKIATGFGGLLYMILGVFTLIAVISAAALPTMSMVRWAEHGTFPGTGRLVGSILAAVAALLLPVAAGAYSVRVGARRLERRGI